MNKYRIFETEQFKKDLEQIARSGRRKIAQKLREFVYPQLRQHPHFGPNIKKLKDFTPDTWRYRIGAWRFFYEIDEVEKIIFMLTASHRSSAY
ncbi:MAG: type II toxin-antitoxin system mRNA interferase toxin, RelE/StbE family [Deltaproteobacteria bacterium]|nr:type II toxin-antitoxin system mRNA interferase toxin, RelE/StbE family [Deltaproteobacteria bacterium]